MKILFVKIPVLLFKFLLVLIIIGTPVLGFWLASSLAAYLNGPTWLSFVAGLLLFPVLPLLWEANSARRRKKKAIDKPRFITVGPRLTMRTLFLCFIFIGSILFWQAETAFLALSTRGDWMLESQVLKKRFDQSQRESIRHIIFGTANRLEWLYGLTHKNPYHDLVDDEGSQSIKPEPVPLPGETGLDEPARLSDVWPWPDNNLHPAVVSLPTEKETDIQSVARYIAEQESDRYRRIKALHDYVADRISYDTNALRTRSFPAQDAETVFQTRKSVCAGYANLLFALGEAIGEEIVIVSGDARGQDSGLSGVGHAWNAARINDKWYLLDATWDSGYVNDYKYTKQYRTDYLFPPPQIIIITHFPDNPDWQLLPEPISRGEFLRQPWIKPPFFAEGMKLIEPQRSQTDVTKLATIKIENPRHQFLMAKYAHKGGQPKKDCEVDRARETCITCEFPNKGTYEVSLYSSNKQYGSTYDFVGKIEFNRRL